jgi:DNA-binding CsgD family transcriptional regulator
MKIISKRIREIVFLFISLPITVVLFAAVIIGFSSTTFLPISVLVFLFMLTLMERIAKFEILRSNKILGTDFKIVENWYANPFFSWDGAKERITSLRAWMAVSYIFIAFGWSIFSFVLVSIGVAGVAVIILSLGIMTLSTFSENFEVVDNGDFFKGNISYDSISKHFTLEFGDSINASTIGWEFPSTWYLGFGIAAILLAAWVLPRNARAMAQMTEGLLSGNYLPRIELELSKIFSSSQRKVSEREVRNAMDNESIQDQLSELSQREKEILALMAQGKSNSGIAKVLYLTEGSVEKHISNILSKLGLPVEENSHRRVLAVLKYLGIKPKNGSMSA